MEKYLLGCDWGTSSCRLCLVNLESQQVIGEVSSEEGIGKMHTAWLNSGREDSSKNRVGFFCDYLSKQIKLLSEHTAVNLHNVAIVISGMASSTIGMSDVPYATLPFAINGNDTVVKRITQTNNFPHEIILVSGVRSENDVMRGEETQLIGLAASLEKDDAKASDGLFIFPGTHSKHAYIKDGRLVKFNTFMTGEIFNIIKNHSILNASLEKQDEKELSEADIDAFKLGVKKSKEARLLNALFTVRTNQLFEKLDKKENYFYLSGLLIGEEMSYLLKEKELNLYVCSGSNLKDFYSMAIDELGLTSRTTIVPGDVVDKAALAGQLVIFQQQQSKTK